jgi:hypothetical protein
MIPKKIQLKHIGYGLLLFVIGINLYFGPFYGVFTQHYDPISAGDLYINTQTLTESGIQENDPTYAAYEQGIENTVQILTNEYWIIRFIQIMLSTIAVAFSLALIVHPLNKK